MALNHHWVGYIFDLCFAFYVQRSGHLFLERGIPGFIVTVTIMQFRGTGALITPAVLLN